MQKPPISPGTRFCAVIGNPVAHSLSPAIHNAAFEKLGLDFVYLACRVENVKEALSGMRALGNFRGMSVTIPHKTEAMKYVDEVLEEDRAIGSINTVINDNGKLTGFGTDGPGALRAMIDAGIPLEGKRVLILGAGGAARAIAFTLALKTRIQALHLMDVEKAVMGQLARDLSAGTGTPVSSELLSGTSLASAMEISDIIIHCTPVGMHPKTEASLIPVELFLPHQVVFDIVYTPRNTKLLKEAARRGCKTLSGVEMFIHQAVLQFEAFTGEKAPVDVMRKVVMENLAK
ncbi:MAG: shikimate dehydrogenase [Proteobacteria bacterium]|nr:shikimate dehydrogenase [Pseudomonadota bacterium]MBU4472324.1 shikimate dehydrogenase [Pseudomonadota bacterium]MCG2752020.1 shikimate dehydrogenase [Desulfobacteraceae bacterium]